MRSLIVDDSRTIRRIQRSLLEQLGHEEIHEAENGQEALDIAQANQIDIILLDWNMPVMDGLTFVQKYRGAGGKAPIIMVTTESEKARVIEAIRAGVNNYVVKPFTPDQLESRIFDTIAKAAA